MKYVYQKNIDLFNRWFLLSFFYTQKTRGASIHEIKESFPLKPSLTCLSTFLQIDSCEQ